MRRFLLFLLDLAVLLAIGYGLMCAVVVVMYLVLG